ncbi:MAG: protein phosphatase 2C domain-containing protein [Gammaproteobacteria bacterium]|nr:protein phosphatase 2C domain-containing protein [Gammaproteobacteria bacterium]
MVELSYGASTDVGNVRDHNEDCYLAVPSLGLWLIADGMGGHACGEVASDIVVRTIGEAIGNGDELANAIQKAHRAILESVEKGIGKRGMGSTVVAIHVSGHHYKLAWVGDSRAYLWDGKLKQISKDHSLVQMLLDTGNLTEREAMNHPQKNIIYQNLGAKDVDAVNVGIIEGQFYKNQKILLCSDGLSDELPRDEIAEVLGEYDNDQKITDGLISAVLKTSANDNVTVVVVAAPDDAPEGIGNDKGGESERITLVGE